jgi:hypothetical protein
VRLNVPHSVHPARTWQGESAGHYEGDTLVVDTIGQKVGPLSMVDRYGVQGTWPEALCAENTRGAGSSWVSLVPQALKPDL